MELRTTVIMAFPIITLVSFLTPAYDLLKYSPGSRTMAMAGVFSPQADDSTAIWHNPAGVAVTGYFDSSMDFVQDSPQKTRISYLGSGKLQTYHFRID